MAVETTHLVVLKQSEFDQLKRYSTVTVQAQTEQVATFHKEWPRDTPRPAPVTEWVCETSFKACLEHAAKIATYRTITVDV